MKLRWTTAVWSVIYLLLRYHYSHPFDRNGFLISSTGCDSVYGFEYKIIYHACGASVADRASDSPHLCVICDLFCHSGIVMGYLYRKRKATMQVLKYGMAVMLVEMLLLLMISTAFFQLNLSEYVDEIVKMTTAPLTEMGVEGGLGGQFLGTELDTQLIKDQTMRLVPFAMIISSFLMTVVTHALARPTLGSMGLTVPRLKPAREWIFAAFPDLVLLAHLLHQHSNR